MGYQSINPFDGLLGSLSDINSSFDRLSKGEVASRVVLDFRTG